MENTCFDKNIYGFCAVNFELLVTIGLPIEAIGLILAVDRILDMCRTAVNVFSDSCGAVIIARTEGEENILTGKRT